MARGQFMVQIGYLAGPEVACASEEALGAWLRCHAYSASLMTSGRIVGGRAWDSRRWLTTARVDLQAIGKGVEAGLLAWEGQDLVVTGYDHDGERIYNAKSEAGKKNGGRSPKAKPAPVEHSSDQSSNHSFDQSSNAFPSLPSPVLPSPHGRAAANSGAPRDADAAARPAPPGLDGPGARAEQEGNDSKQAKAKVTAEQFAAARRRAESAAMPASRTTDQHQPHPAAG